MLTKYDECMCHQISRPFEMADQTDRNWSDHMYLSAYDNTQKIHLGFRFGKYINRNVMDAGGGITINNRQHTVRASREILPMKEADNNPLVEVVGPFTHEILEPLKKMHYALGENQYGVSFDVEFEGVAAPIEEPGGLTRRSGIPLNDTVRFFQLGRFSGKAKVEGKSFDISQKNGIAWRDRSWGVRGMTGVPRKGIWWWNWGNPVPQPEVGLQPFPSPEGVVGVFVGVQFKDYTLYYSHNEGPDGKIVPSFISGQRGYLVYNYGNPKPPKYIIDSNIEFEFFPGTRHHKTVRGVFTLDDGTKKRFDCKRLDTLFELVPTGYCGWKDWWLGQWKGPYAIDGDVLDLSDPTVIDEADFCPDIPIECNFDGEIGYGTLQPSNSGYLPKYGFGDKSERPQH